VASKLPQNFNDRGRKELTNVLISSGTVELSAIACAVSIVDKISAINLKSECLRRAALTGLCSRRVTLFFQFYPHLPLCREYSSGHGCNLDLDTVITILMHQATVFTDTVSNISTEICYRNYQEFTNLQDDGMVGVR
jgi:hypothetical protein